MARSQTAHQGPKLADTHSPQPPIVVVQGGVAEVVDGADVLIVDLDVTELDTPSIRAEEREDMEERRAEARKAGAPDWLIAEIDECIERLRPDHVEGSRA